MSAQIQVGNTQAYHSLLCVLINVFKIEKKKKKENVIQFSGLKMCFLYHGKF